MRESSIIPGWHDFTLGEAVMIQTGFAKGAVKMNGRSVRRPYLRAANVQDGYLKLDDIAETEAPDHLCERCALRPGDVLIVEASGNAEKVGCGWKWSGEVPNCLHQNHVFALRVNADILDPDYLATIITSDRWKSHFRRGSSKSTTLASINTKQVKEVRLTLPPLCEQRAIVHVLSAWMDAIAQSERLLNLRRRLKRGLMQQLLVGRRRFPEYADEAWRDVRLRDVAEVVCLRNRGALGRDSVKAVTKASGMVPMRPELIAGSIERYQIVHPDAFAYNPMRLNIGSIARWRGSDEVLVSPDYVVFRCKSDQLDPAYLDQFRRSHTWSSFMSACGNGSVRVRIWFDDLGVMKLKLPPLAEQRKIAAVLATADREIDLLEQQLAALREQKKGLMQRLLTGRVRVSGDRLKVQEQ